MNQNTGKWLRRIIGIACAAFMWGNYLIRITLGIGLMHDPQGNQSPALHYLGGALIVTAMVAVWIFGREWWERNHPE